jgi:hypothetical protein
MVISRSRARPAISLTLFLLHGVEPRGAAEEAQFAAWLPAVEVETLSSELPARLAHSSL